MIISYYQIVTFKKLHICKTNSRTCSTYLIEIALKINFFIGFPLPYPTFSLILPRAIFLLNRDSFKSCSKFLSAFFRFRKHSSIYLAHRGWDKIHRTSGLSIYDDRTVFQVSVAFFIGFTRENLRNNVIFMPV